MQNVSAFFGVQVWTNKGKTTNKTITEHFLSNASSHQVSFRASYSCFICQTKNQLSARKSVSERHHFFAAPERTNLSLEGWWASLRWLDKANTTSQMIWKSKSRKMQNTDVRGFCESLKQQICRTAGETKQAGWSGTLYSIEREIVRSTASLLTLMYDF